MKLTSLTLVACLLSGSALAGITGVVKPAPVIPPAESDITPTTEPGTVPQDNGYLDPLNGRMKLWFIEDNKFFYHPIQNAIEIIKNSYQFRDIIDPIHAVNPLLDFVLYIHRKTVDRPNLHTARLSMGMAPESRDIPDQIENDLIYAKLALYKAGYSKLFTEIGWYNNNTGHYGGIRAVQTFRSLDGLTCATFHYYINFSGMENRGLSVGCFYENMWWDVIGGGQND